MENISKMIFVALIQVKCILNQSKGVKNLIKLAIAEESKIYSRPEPEVKKIYNGYVKYCKNIVLGLTYLTYVAGAALVFVIQYNSHVSTKYLNRLSLQIINYMNLDIEFASNLKVIKTQHNYTWNGTVKFTQPNLTFDLLFDIYEAYEYFNTVPLEQRNVTSKPLPAPMWYPFDTNKYYVLPVLHQWFNVLQTVMYNSSIQGLIHTVMIFIKAEFKILEYDLIIVGISLTTKQEEKDNDEDHNLIVLKSLCRKHQQLIKWVKDFNDSIKYLLLLEYSVSSMMLASTLIQILFRVKVFFNVPFLFLCVVQIYVLGWNANEIILQSSTELSNSLYKCKWYEQSKEAKLIVHLMMTRCQRPLTLSIGPFGDMDLDASISTTKLAYTFLSVFM